MVLVPLAVDNLGRTIPALPYWLLSSLSNFDHKRRHKLIRVGRQAQGNHPPEMENRRQS
jgi:hypothetical protein